MIWISIINHNSGKKTNGNISHVDLNLFVQVHEAPFALLITLKDNNWDVFVADSLAHQRLHLLESFSIEGLIRLKGREDHHFNEVAKTIEFFAADFADYDLRGVYFKQLALQTLVFILRLSWCISEAFNQQNLLIKLFFELVIVILELLKVIFNLWVSILYALIASRLASI